MPIIKGLKRRFLKIVVFSGLLLFLYIARTLVEAIDRQNVEEYNDTVNDHRGTKISRIIQSTLGISPKESNDPVVISKGAAIGRKDKLFPRSGVSGERQTQDRSKEYFVDHGDIDDMNVTYPPFVDYSDENGPGEWGARFTLNLTKAELKQKESSRKKNGFNQLASDHVSVHRRLRDDRLPECKKQTYPHDLPAASVIICFHNEAWSTLLRSVNSVLDRSPSHLLKEVILVDDASTFGYLKAPLRKYMSKLDKVKIVRMKHQQGLIRARLAGYDVASGPVLVFLDSHIECFPGWLEPLLSRISQNPRAVPYPQINVINAAFFSTGMIQNVTGLGIFDWKLLSFKWAHIYKDRKTSRVSAAEPFSSPTMPGGIFAIDKAWFTTLGAYDPGLKYWGAENMELSFKIWMCNGSIEVLPCSHVGHVFRQNNPIKWKQGGNPILNNAIRVAEVWLDEYKHIVYEQSGTILENERYGDVTDRKKLRSSLKCHDFRWYIENIYPEVEMKISTHAGEIRSAYKASLCIDSKARGGVYSCHGRGGNQYWLLEESGRLTQSYKHSMCYSKGKVSRGYQYDPEHCSWTYRDDNTLYLKSHNKCLELNDELSLEMQVCNGEQNQKWKMEASKFQSDR